MNLEVPGWRTEKVEGELEVQKQLGLVAVGWRFHREDCDCQISLGVRLDRMEETFGLAPCEQHKAVSRRVVERLRALPGQDRPIAELAAELFAEELAANV